MTFIDGLIETFQPGAASCGKCIPGQWQTVKNYVRVIHFHSYFWLFYITLVMFHRCISSPEGNSYIYIYIYIYIILYHIILYIIYIYYQFVLVSQADCARRRWTTWPKNSKSASFSWAFPRWSFVQTLQNLSSKHYKFPEGYWRMKLNHLFP